MDDKFKFNDDDDGGGGNEWLATYGDLVTLLLCFFILLYSMSSVDSHKFKAIKASLSDIGVAEQKESLNPSVGDSISKIDTAQATKDMNNIYKQVKKVVDEKGLKSQVTISNRDDGILLQFQDEFLFDIGKAVLKDNSRSLLRQIASILREYNKQVKIEGHTDNIPIKNSEYKSNWELSTARAISVVRLFTDELPEGERLDAKKFEVSGYGEHHPVALNDSEEGRHKNRRIEIFIKKDRSK
ncbi:OmpA family protein [Clostridium sp. A1-XYC3]|uniref:OmpA family protein n=1 Tax=Clostridium tanneri TaxID=3037988 RepID=A0ABU4JVB3_9CLOT|nr:flagellar motor protein MotB [Clostridium sp. A1-XYC3]MDW8801884.1 OmpA family protein [Clostridium sp. A1-XYC3]